jgi:hypothetical protein
MNVKTAFVAAVAVKGAIDQKKANRARRKQLDEQSRLKERKTLQKKGLSQYDRNQFKGQDEGSARGVFVKSIFNSMRLFIIHHLHCWLIPNSSAFWVKVLSA